MVERGELITYVIAGAELTLSASEVFATAADNFNVVTGFVLQHAHEGATWIRGWHTKDSDSGMALLAATALLRESVGHGGLSGTIGGYWVRSRGLTSGQPKSMYLTALYSNPLPPVPAVSLPQIVMVGSTK